MICKYCNAEISEEHAFCPQCGRRQTPKQKTFTWKLALAISGALVALSVLAVVLLTALGVQVLPRENGILVKGSYTTNDIKFLKNNEVVVATIKDKTLTNAQLQIFYKMQVMDFVEYYGNYASYIGLDLNSPLSEQVAYFDDTMTWEQYLLNASIETWRNYQTLALLAEEAGYTMSEEWQKSLDEQPEKLKKQAEEGKYESVDEMLADAIGPGCTEEAYMEYMRLMYLSNDYYGTQYDKMLPTDEEVVAYFDENADAFAQSGITKESGLISSVRHILIEPEGGTQNEETGEVTYSDADWAACQEKAQKLLDEWKKGEATQESFAALVKANTDDPGSADNGGLYEDIYSGSGMVKEFEAWSIDASRKEGDTGLVKTEYGYHLMYFVSGESYWLSTARTQLLSDRTEKLITDAEAQWPMKANYRKIFLAELDLT